LTLFRASILCINQLRSWASSILPLCDIDLDSFLVAPLSFDIEGFCYLSDQLLDELRLASRQGMLMYFSRRSVPMARSKRKAFARVRFQRPGS
jgi:hypothetical protein